jgi:chromosome partitioning protein
MIIIVGSEKGGVGKSTMATNISVFLAKAGKEVILVDADRQGTSSTWSQDRKESGVECVSKHEDIQSALETLNSKFEYVVVDCPGRDSVELRSGLMVADIFISPVRPSQADLDTLPKVISLIATSRVYNKKLKSYCVLTQSPSSSTETKEAREALLAYEDSLTPLESIIYERRSYRDALGYGLGVIEMKDPKATLEMTNVCKEIFTWF